MRGPSRRGVGDAGHMLHESRIKHHDSSLSPCSWAPKEVSFVEKQTETYRHSSCAHHQLATDGILDPPARIQKEALTILDTRSGEEAPRVNNDDDEISGKGETFTRFFNTLRHKDKCTWAASGK